MQPRAWASHATAGRLSAAGLPGYDPGDSDLETRAHRVLLGAGLTVPTQQYRVRVAGRTFRIDLATRSTTTPAIGLD